MWFKNLLIYRLTDPVKIEDLQQQLSELPFAPCGSLDRFKCGFFPPLGSKSENFTHEVMGHVMIAIKRQEKILPPAAIAEKLAEKIEEIEENESRGVGRKERATLKDEIIFSMLPNAPKKSDIDYGYIDVKRQLLIINTSSQKRGEDFCSKLREAIGSLRCIELSTVSVPTHVMTRLVKTGEIPENFQLGENLELDGNLDKRVVQFKKHDLTGSQIEACLETGMYASKLALDFKKSIFFEVNQDLIIKNLVFSDVITEKSNDNNSETREQKFDSDFAVMTIYLGDFIDAMIELFGGLTPLEN